MRTVYAKTLKDLQAVIEGILEQDPEATWNGWDDGSLLVYSSKGDVSVEPREPPPPRPMVEYQCRYCGFRRSSDSGPISCTRCSWRPMMKTITAEVAQ